MSWAIREFSHESLGALQTQLHPIPLQSHINKTQNELSEMLCCQIQSNSISLKQRPLNDWADFCLLNKGRLFVLTWNKYLETLRFVFILLTYLLTELSPSWEAANCAAIQEIPSNFKEPEGSSPLKSKFNPVWYKYFHLFTLTCFDRCRSSSEGYFSLYVSTIQRLLFIP
jgi:energy-converting hydrogenase Eha subunit C